MNKVRIGIICPSEIAFRRFLPSLAKNQFFEYVGVAIATSYEWAGQDSLIKDYTNVIYNEKKKALKFRDAFGGAIFNSYQELIQSKEVDAVYLPLPPALHYKWAKLVLENKKHVLLEKPFTINKNHTTLLISMARENNLALHENYMFMFHNQLTSIRNIISEGKIGKVRMYRISFGFPLRAKGDFRYNKNLGGGALYDCGGYTIKYADSLLGESAKLLCSSSYYEKEFDVDIFGSATLVNNEGIVAQVSFGMDNDYKCELEVWGSLGSLVTKRVLTAPDGFVPELVISSGSSQDFYQLPSDETFAKSIDHFYKCIQDTNLRANNFDLIERQALLIDEFEKMRQ